jgi:hypothetical protein
MDIVEALEAIAKGSHKSDETLLNLSKGIIETVKVLEAVVASQGRAIRDLQMRHEALLSAFYSHCQDVITEDNGRTH